MNEREQPDESSEFQGGAFHPDLGSGQASGTLRIGYDGVRFESAKGSVKLPMVGLKIALGGANDRLIFFTHPEHAKVAIHTADHAVLKHPLLTQTAELLAQVGGVQTKKRTAQAVLLSVVGVLVLGIVLLVLGKDKIAAAATSAIPVSWEVALGDQVFEQVTKREKMVKNAAVDAQLKTLTGPLLEGIQDARYPLTFHIVEDATLNAYAIPGGHVVLHSGLLMAADRPEQVAGVLAHEIAHVTRRHGFRSVLSSAGLYLVLQTFLGDLSGLAAVIVNNGAFLADRKFSRDFEREADDTGWEYLLKAKVNPRGMIEFFEKLGEEEKKMEPVAGMTDALAFMSTHPGTKERMERLEARWKELGEKKDFRTFDLNYAAFKDTLRANLHSAAPEAGKKKGN